MSKWLTLIISVLILAALFFDAAFKSSQPTPVSCTSLWGPAQVVEENSCKITVAPSSEPSLLKVSLEKPGFLIAENLVVKVGGTQLTPLRGLEVRLKSQDKLVGTYSLPLYSEASQNLLQNTWSTSLSLPLSSLKDLDLDKLSAPIDNLELYLVGSASETLELQVESLWWEKKPAKGRISLTFDDGYQEHHLAASLMAPYGLRGTAYLIPEAIDQPNYLSRAQLAEMRAWGWDLASHLVTPITEYSEEKLAETMTQALAQLKQLGSAGDEVHFAYPLGQYSQKSHSILSNSLQSARLAGGGVESLPPLDPLRLRAVNVTPALTADELVQLADRAIANGDWLILMFHYLDQAEKGELSYSKVEFQKLLRGLGPMQRYVQPVRTVIESI